MPRGKACKRVQGFVLSLAALAFPISLRAAPVYQGCFSRETDLPTFLQVIRDSGLPLGRISMAISNACGEVDPEGTFKGINKEPANFTHIIDKTSNFVLYGLLGQGTSAFSRLQGNETEKEYRNRLEAIKSNPNRNERIRAVYELAAQYQGKYDHDFEKGSLIERYHLWHTPSKIINDAKDKGVGGICRNFAALLYWSLLQVARVRGDQNMALDETSFSVEIATGTLPLGGGSSGGHAWVRVNLPVKRSEGNGYRFESVDLDTTWYPNQFSVLAPRQSGISDASARRILQRCESIRRCIFDLQVEAATSQVREGATPTSGAAR